MRLHFTEAQYILRQLSVCLSVRHTLHLCRTTKWTVPWIYYALYDKGALVVGTASNMDKFCT